AARKPPIRSPRRRGPAAMAGWVGPMPLRSVYSARTRISWVARPGFRRGDALHDDLVHLARGAPIELAKACSVGHETAGLDHFPEAGDGRQFVLEAHLGNLHAERRELGIVAQQHRGARLTRGGEQTFQVLRSAFDEHL